MHDIIDFIGKTCSHTSKDEVYGVCRMNFQQLYFHLFNQITNALTQLEAQNYGAAAALLRRAQQEGEDAYLEATSGE